ncbi:hypothetical protein [Kibdelosporangium phytohabitans]|nr:hypothetical protein [Kibdelosporangium phytohabitans]MBE1463229.1 hypothetical protein [Kibdelosporangium phytohabitans]
MDITPPKDTRTVRLVFGLSPLVLAAVLGYFVSVILVMGSAACMGGQQALICSPRIQSWVVWLPIGGAAAGLLTGGLLGYRSIKHDKPVAQAIGTGWMMWVLAEMLAVIMGTT